MLIQGVLDDLIGLLGLGWFGCAQPYSYLGWKYNLCIPRKLKFGQYQVFNLYLAELCNPIEHCQNQNFQLHWAFLSQIKLSLLLSLKCGG